MGTPLSNSNIRFNHDDLEDAVRRTHPDAKYIRDGIILPDRWCQSRTKVLFIRRSR